MIAFFNYIWRNIRWRSIPAPLVGQTWRLMDPAGEILEVTILEATNDFVRYAFNPFPELGMQFKKTVKAFIVLYHQISP